MTITVVNKYKEPDHIYCGRGSALGNPFPMHMESQRDDVCDKYEEWFNEMYLHSLADSPFMKLYEKILEAARIGDVNLGCFCAPKRCHCDTIKQSIEQVLSKT